MLSPKNSRLEAALAAVARGWEVFPAPPDGSKKSLKSAAHSGGAKWGKSKDPTQIRSDWRKWPEANLGIPTGPDSGFFVVEADTAKGHGVDGIANLRALEAKHGKLPTTRTAVSPSGSEHYYFRWPRDGSIIRNSASKIAPGVDVRGAGGMVLAPPSTRPDGAYKWTSEAEIAEASPWLLEAVLAESSRPAPAARGAGARPASDVLDVLAAVAVTPNTGEGGWEAWNDYGMAIFAATAGADDGEEIFQAWSATSPKYDVNNTADKWQKLHGCPPTSIGAGTIFDKADKACPGWRGLVREREGSILEQMAAVQKLAQILGTFERYPKGENKGKIVGKNQRNIRRAMAALGIKVSYDQFNDASFIEGLPGHHVIDDAAIEKLWLLIDERFHILPAKDFFLAVVQEAARRNTFHPVVNYLDSLKWDGVNRLDTWLIDYGGAEDSDYVRAVGTIVLVAAVRRVKKPGCKFDEMLILESEQGRNKSTMLATLAYRPEWFTDDLPLNAPGKVVIEQTRGKWLVEASELSGLRKGDVEHLKALLSRQVDQARMAYGRLETRRPRQCIFVGTTNAEFYLRDITGNRRFWPIKVGDFRIEKLESDRDQLWAEAVAREKAGESIRLDPSLWKDAAEQQEMRAVNEPWLELLSGVFQLKMVGNDPDDPINIITGKILNEDVWTIVGLASQHRTQQYNERLGSVMKALGFERKKVRFDGISRHGYVRGDEKQREVRIHIARSLVDGEVAVGHTLDEANKKLRSF
jgi:predicted P-loop ATPase